MTIHFLKTVAVSAALLCSTAFVAANAIDVGVTVGGGANAAASVTTGNTKATVNIGSGSGPLATVNSTGSSVGGSDTNATVNLGSLLDGLGLGGGGTGPGIPGDGPGAGDPNGNGTGVGGSPGGGGYQSIVDSLSASDRQMLALRCRSVLFDPTIYKQDVVDFCRIIAQLKM